MIKPVAGLLFGIMLGCLFPTDMTAAYTKLFSAALLAALDSIFGGLRAATVDKFNDVVFITGFVSNTLLAAFLVYVGDMLGIDLYYVALLAFGFRIFKNLAGLRRYLLKRK